MAVQPARAHDAQRWSFLRRGAAPMLAAALLASGCLGRLTQDGVAARVAQAPADQLSLPLHTSRPASLLRTESGWCGSHEVRFGGDPQDPAVATIRTARFATAAAAHQAFAQLTPPYLALLLRDRITWMPQPTDAPVAPRGAQFQVLAYGVRLPPEVPPSVTLTGQLTSVHMGHFVILVESIGVWPEPLGAALDAMVAAAAAAAPGC
jgi:hypothetical protein